jgi:hypothetical protein
MVGRWGGPNMPGEEELVCGAGAEGVAVLVGQVREG